MGREVLYLSKGKLGRFSLDQPRPSVTQREMEGSIQTPVLSASGRLGPVPDPPELPSDEWQRAYARLEQVLAYLETSARAPRDIDDPRLRPGDWAKFEREIKFGHFHRDKAPVEDRVVLFRGSAHKEAHRSFHEVERDFYKNGFAPRFPPDGTDFMLTGWIGHMPDVNDLGKWSNRMGSATDDLYDLCSQIAELDRAGSDAVPEPFGNLPHIESSQTGEPLDSLIRSVYSMSTWADPTKYSQMTVERAYTRGITQVFDILPATEYESRLVLGSPLYIEWAAEPEPEPLTPPRREELHWWTRILKRPRPSGRPALPPERARRELPSGASPVNDPTEPAASRARSDARDRERDGHGNSAH